MGLLPGAPSLSALHGTPRWGWSTLPTPHPRPPMHSVSVCSSNAPDFPMIALAQTSLSKTKPVPRGTWRHRRQMKIAQVHTCTIFFTTLAQSPPINMQGQKGCTYCLWTTGKGPEPGLGPPGLLKEEVILTYHFLLGEQRRKRRQWPYLSHSSRNAWHPGAVPGWKQVRVCTVNWVNGWRDEQIDGRKDSQVRVEVNLFFPELVLLLDSGHSHTGWVFSQGPTGREACGDKGKKERERYQCSNL